MRFTFKRRKQETGQQGIAQPYPSVDIKLDKKIVGWISAPSPLGHDGWYIFLRLEDKSKNCNWKNAKLKGDWETEAAAKAFLQTNADAILAKFTLVPEED